MFKPLKIAHIASEVEPFSKSGGLGNVLGSLPRAHAELGHEVIVITPFYEEIIDAKAHVFEVISENEHIELSSGVWEEVSYLKTVSGDVSIYFIASHKFFSGDKLYGFKNENQRFMFFDVAALSLLKKINFKADVLHCHDWHTGLIPYFLKGRYKKDPFWENTATLFTIHNLAYQLGHNWWDIPAEKRDDGRGPLPAFDDERLEDTNFAKRAIRNADAVNAVSETYREEIMTKDFGQELHRVLKNREKSVFGIVNGIDYSDYNPLTDPGLFKHYSVKSIGRRRFNKRWLQRYYHLPINPDVPLICMTSRVVEQKGFRLLAAILPTLLRSDIQLIVMGDGDKQIMNFLHKVQRRFPKQLVVVPFDGDRETSLYAGSDILLLPSRFEPCGINQMIALRYGAIPVVHHIGGLADTIDDFDPRVKKNGGNGFTFSPYNSRQLLVAITRAIESYKYKPTWRKLVMSGLKEANSWILPAEKYIDLYDTTRKLKRKSDRAERSK